jgi:hypothetical protein
MEMKNDDYLWDGSGEPDADLQHLERLLSPLRSDPPRLELPDARLSARAGSVVPFLVALAAMIVLVALVWRTRSAESSWQVASLAGQPRIGDSAIGNNARLAVGDTLTTDAASQAKIDVNAMGEVRVEGDSRVRLLETGANRYRLALDRGTLVAFITAPPGRFVVDTPSARATDLGCVYSLHVDDDGTGVLSVTGGWVAFEFNGRESFVPAGASCRTDRRAGPGTPRYDDADREFQAAIEQFDLNRSDADRESALNLLLDRARPRDAMTLWHLLSRVQPVDRGRAFDALARRVPPPPGVAREQVLALDRRALDLWWNALGLRDVTFWRTWKRPLPQ